MAKNRLGMSAKTPGYQYLYEKLFDIIDAMNVADRLRVLRAVAVRYEAERRESRRGRRGGPKPEEVIFGDRGQPGEDDADE